MKRAKVSHSVRFERNSNNDTIAAGVGIIAFILIALILAAVL